MMGENYYNLNTDINLSILNYSIIIILYLLYYNHNIIEFITYIINNLNNYNMKLLIIMNTIILLYIFNKLKVDINISIKF